LFENGRASDFDTGVLISDQRLTGVGIVAFVTFPKLREWCYCRSMSLSASFVTDMAIVGALP